MSVLRFDVAIYPLPFAIYPLPLPFFGFLLEAFVFPFTPPADPFSDIIHHLSFLLRILPQYYYKNLNNNYKALRFLE
jgi:hypothetical protein